MNIDYDILSGEPRLLLKVPLEPLQGHRFQPTGFSDLGPARYQAPDGTEMLLVESNQSVANRMEAACWDEAAEDLIEDLRGIPYVQVLCDGKPLTTLTNSILEAHRVNSEYIMKKGSGKTPNTDFYDTFTKELDFKDNRPVNFKALHRLLLKYDPNSLVHGVFLEEVAGRLRVTRALSGFVEASDVKMAESGGVKNNDVEPTLKEGEGNVPYPRTEFTAKEIVAYFNLDLSLVRGFGLGETASKFLVVLSIFKILRFLSTGLRLRTACDLSVKDGIEVQAPEGFTLPSERDALADCKELIAKLKEDKAFAEPAVTTTVYPPVKEKS
ncbi:MAG: type I-U CRISPR-associated RAMP protein Csb1/Cas7u [Verrucomicrobiales bacterium]